MDDLTTTLTIHTLVIAALGVERSHEGTLLSSRMMCQFIRNLATKVLHVTRPPSRRNGRVGLFSC